MQDLHPTEQTHTPNPRLALQTLRAEADQLYKRCVDRFGMERAQRILVKYLPEGRDWGNPTQIETQEKLIAFNVEMKMSLF